MKLLVWNSQGGKWDDWWRYYLGPLYVKEPREDVLGLLVEAGWGPWVKSGDVIINDPHLCDSSMTYFDQTSPSKSPFCKGIVSNRRNRALWVPWIANFDAQKTNSRCSLGGALLPVSLHSVITAFTAQDISRPVLRFELKKGGVTFTVFLVHMVSGNPKKAQRLLADLVNAMKKYIEEGTAAMILGDINVDLLKGEFYLPKNWRFLRLGYPTQQKGGELDYGLLYDPNGQLGGARVVLVDKYKSAYDETGTNESDHSILRYDIP